MEEIWKDIKGFERLYQVSNKGKIKSFTGYGKVKERIMKLTENGDGYLYVTLTKNKKQKAVRVSRIVTSHFIPNPKNKLQVNHKNGIKTDNRVGNLEWCTSSENIKHSFKMGLSKRPFGNKRTVGEKNAHSKLTKKEVKEIREKNGNKTQKEIAKEYEVEEQIIYRILKYKTWKHI